MLFGFCGNVYIAHTIEAVYYSLFDFYSDRKTFITKTQHYLLIFYS